MSDASDGTGKITIDGVTVEPIRLTANRRGCRSARFDDRQGDPCLLSEYPATGRPVVLLLGATGNLMMLDRAHVAALLPHLQRFVERGDLGGEDAGTPAPAPPPARIEDISSIGAKKARLRAERIAADRAAEGAGDGLSVIDDETA